MFFHKFRFERGTSDDPLRFCSKHEYSGSGTEKQIVKVIRIALNIMAGLL